MEGVACACCIENGVTSKDETAKHRAEPIGVHAFADEQFEVTNANWMRRLVGQRLCGRWSDVEERIGRCDEGLQIHPSTGVARR